MKKITIDLPLQEPLPLEGNELKIVVRMPGEFEVAFAIDPASAESQDDKFILFSTDEESTYFQEKTPKDNISDNEGETVIRFTGLKKDLNYSLGVDPGKEGDPYLVFEDLPYGGWEAGPVDPEMTCDFKVKFKVNPKENGSEDYKFILFSTDAAQKVNQTKTVNDDLTDGDDTVEIVYENLDRSLSYSLQVDPGLQKEPYFIFEDRPYTELSKGN